MYDTVYSIVVCDTVYSIVVFDTTNIYTTYQVQLFSMKYEFMIRDLCLVIKKQFLIGNCILFVVTNKRLYMDLT